MPQDSIGQPILVDIDTIQPNEQQPRKDFEPAAINELAESIKVKGIIQPILVRRLADAEAKGGRKYEIIAGERRWCAAKLADLTQVPIIIRPESAPADVLILSLVENIQRHDLNPMEEATAFKQLMDMAHLTQEQVADAVGKSRVTVANTLRLLALGGAVQDAVRSGKLSVGHAKVLLGIPDTCLQGLWAARCQAEGLSVCDLEKIMAIPDDVLLANAAKRKKGLAQNAPPAHIQDMETRLSRHLGTRVVIEEGKRRGRIVIEFYSVSDFDRLTKIMGLT